jgi:hypothetical protein
MTKQEEVCDLLEILGVVLILFLLKILQRKELALKTLREENQYLVEELTELRKFKENILNVTSKTRVK